MKPSELITNKNEDLKNSGIYIIYYENGNKGYIGRSKNIYRRWQEHKGKLKRNKHDNQYLQNIYNKYGLEVLKIFILEKTNIELDKREAFYLGQIDVDLRINLMSINKLIEMSEETKQKISKANKGKIRSIESKERYRQSKLGKKWIPVKEEIKKKFSKIYTGKGNPFYGKNHKKETKEKISKANKGRTAWNKGIPRTEEEKKKMSEAHKGMKMKKETKQKISKKLKELKKKRDKDET